MKNARSRHVSWRWLQAVVLAVLLATMGACDGSDPVGPTPTPTPTPGPTRTLIQSVTFSNYVGVEESKKQGFPFDSARLDFTIDKAGKIEVDIDWTSASNPIFIGMYVGKCLSEDFYAETCPEVGSETLTVKPATVDFGQVQPGLYEIWTGNLGTTIEAGSYKVYLVS
jgi:hypothetical protein